MYHVYCSGGARAVSELGTHYGPTIGAPTDCLVILFDPRSRNALAKLSICAEVRVALTNPTHRQMIFVPV